MTANSEEKSYLERIDPDSEWLSPRFEITDPRFNQVELQIVSWCNRACDFCPSGNFSVPKLMMTTSVVDRVIEELLEYKFEGTVGLHLMCEPLLHREFTDIVKKFRKQLPKTFIRIDTNGDVLDKKVGRIVEYFDAGLNEILINCYNSSEQRKKRNDALQLLTKTDRSIWYFNDRGRQPIQKRSNWRVVKLRDFFEEGYTVRNWAGHVDEQRGVEVKFPIALSCARPFRRVHVNYKGQILLCNNDWKYEVVIGDLMTDSLKEIWNSSKMTEYYRPKLTKCSRDSVLCRTCDSGLPWAKAPPVTVNKGKVSGPDRVLGILSRA